MKLKNPTRWDNYFMALAETVSGNSKCLSRKIGAVIVKDKSILSTGYNGPPRGMPHCETRNPNQEKVCPRRLAGYGSGEGLHLCVAGHAERNAIVNAAREGVSIKGATLYCNCGTPCTPCLIEIINAGISRVVCQVEGLGDEIGYYDEMSEYILNNSTLQVDYMEK